MANRLDQAEKFRIIFIRQSLMRVFRNLFFLTILILTLWWIAPYIPGWFRPPNDTYLIWGAVLFFILMVLALLFRSRGYLQAQPRLLVIQVPLFRLRIPYEMIENVRMAVYKDLVDSKTLPWGQRRLLTPALSQTVVQINVHKFPVPMFLLRLFLPNYLILPADRGKGLVVYVKQYLELTNEIDSRLKAERVDSAKSKPKARQDDEISLEGFFDLGT